MVSYYISSTIYLRTIWDYSLGNYQAINNELTNTVLFDHTSDISANVLNLTQIIHKTMHDNIPHKQIIIRSQDKPWFTSTVKKLYRDSHRAFKLKNKTNYPHHIEQPACQILTSSSK